MTTVLQHPAILGGLLDPQSLIDHFGDIRAVGRAARRVHRVLAVPVPAGRLTTVHRWPADRPERDRRADSGRPASPLSAAAVASNLVGYFVGARIGPALFDRPDSRFFKQEYIVKTHAFFDRYGNRAIVLARFVPIVRTFITLGRRRRTHAPSALRHVQRRLAESSGQPG